MRYVFEESKLDNLIRAAYDLSVVQGMGFLHARAGGLDEDTLAQIKAYERGECRVSMDYVHGRAVKLCVFRDGKSLYINADSWFDHSAESLRELAARADLGEPVETAG